MIKDTLENAKLYYNLSNGLKKALLYIKENDLKAMENGKYLIDGEKLYITINTYKTKDNADWETHRNYIDIQYVVSGEEKIGIYYDGSCKEKLPYDIERDIEFFDGGRGDFMTMRTGDFMVIYPRELHKPGIKLNDNIQVKKAVIKLAVDY